MKLELGIAAPTPPVPGSLEQVAQVQDPEGSMPRAVKLGPGQGFSHRSPGPARNQQKPEPVLIPFWTSLLLLGI